MNSKEMTKYYEFIGKCNDKYELATACALIGCDRKPMKIPAALQRQWLGFPVFGRNDVYYTEDNEIYVSWSVCFGTMREGVTWSLDEILKFGREQKKAAYANYVTGR